MNTIETRLDRGLLPAFQALADENRLRILDVLREGEHCVCELQSALSIAQSLLSHHLRVLRDAGVVRTRRDGRWIHYALAPETLERLGDAVAGLHAAAETHREPCPTGACTP